MIERIPPDKVHFHAHSFFDPIGRLFWWRGELYREIKPEWAPFFQQLCQADFIQRLVDQGVLIQTEIVPFALDGGDMVLHHRRVPFVTYPCEWCPAMFKDAMLAMVDFMFELAQHKLVLKDGHLWNLLFDSCQPVFVDFPSIARNEDKSLWPAYEDFCQRCLYPLLLMAHGQEQIARLLLAEGMTISVISS